MKFKLSICIPAYNRSEYLAPLLDSICSQLTEGVSVVIAEDLSPERSEIRRIVSLYQNKYRNVYYYENDFNLGYDGNIRNLIEASTGEYVMFLGNDDLLAEGAIDYVLGVLKRKPGIGQIIRSWAEVDLSGKKILQEFRYVKSDLMLEPGFKAIAFSVRRSVAIMGLIFHRDMASGFATKEFDGTLYYQLWISGNLASISPVFASAKIIAHRRCGAPPDFGNSETEKASFAKGFLSPEGYYNFIGGYFRIAKKLNDTLPFKVYGALVRDIGKYSYPLISVQRHLPVLDFIRYCNKVAGYGLRFNFYYNIYFLALLFLGRNRCDKFIFFMKKLYGYTPVL